MIHYASHRYSHLRPIPIMLPWHGGIPPALSSCGAASCMSSSADIRPDMSPGELQRGSPWDFRGSLRLETPKMYGKKQQDVRHEVGVISSTISLAVSSSILNSTTLHVLNKICVYTEDKLIGIGITWYHYLFDLARSYR